MTWSKRTLREMPKAVKAATSDVQAQWVAQYRQRNAARGARWRLENPGEKKAAAARLYAANREEKLAANKRWRLENPEKAARCRVKAKLKERGIPNPPHELVELFTQLRLARRELKKGTES